MIKGVRGADGVLARTDEQLFLKIGEANRAISIFNGLNTWYPNNFKYITAISAFSES